MFSNVNGLPLDDERFSSLFETADRLRCPIFLHPARGATFADYPGEAKSKYEIWWTFGWPYETSAAMQRLVFSRLFDRLPDIRIVAHHLGAMVPYFEGRVGYGLDQFGSRTADEDYDGSAPLDAAASVRLFQDVLGGHGGVRQQGSDRVRAEASSASTRSCSPRMLRSIPEGGSLYIRETIKVIDSLEISETDRGKIYRGNAERLFNRTF